MPVVVYGNIQTNIDPNTEAYEWLQEINNHYGDEKYVITKTTINYRRFLKKKTYTYYSIYWKLAEGEYQQLLSFKNLDLQDIECYLLGCLNGLSK